MSSAGRRRFDLLIRGGTVVDPGSDRNEQADVAVAGGRIAAVERGIPADDAGEVIDAAGLVVTPGLVDLHTHAFRGATFWGVDADAFASRSGVTAWVDAGSPGAYTLDAFRELIVGPARARMRAFVNIATLGLVGQNHELANLANCDVGLLRRVVASARDVVVGVKVRIGTPTVGENGLEPLRLAIQAAEESELPVMVHIAFAPPEIDEVAAMLRAGDILTHCFTGTTMRIVDRRGRLRDSVREAIDRGVVLDLGHGTGSFAWSTAEPLVAAGLRPDVISTDIHQLSAYGPMFDLPTCMSKLLALGMSLDEVVRATTIRPAELLGLDAGTLRPGAPADVAAFSLERGRFPLFDAHLEPREAGALLESRLTMIGGAVLDPAPLPEPAPWVELTPAQRAWLGDEVRGDRPISGALRLTEPDHFAPAFPRDAPPG